MLERLVARGFSRAMAARLLLFLFAGAPGKTFSKEEIVQTVWSVAYHPLRHDAALFTNIMRIRRLLGEDGAEIIRVTEDGYRFEPPSDFVFVSRSASSTARSAHREHPSPSSPYHSYRQSGHCSL